jgi:hypothetical protein
MGSPYVRNRSCLWYQRCTWLQLFRHGAFVIRGIHGPLNGPLLGTNPAIDCEKAKVDKMIGSIAVARQFRTALSRNFGHGLGTLAWG